MCGDVQEKTLYGLELKAGVFPNLMFPPQAVGSLVSRRREIGDTRDGSDHGWGDTVYEAMGP